MKKLLLIFSRPTQLENHDKLFDTLTLSAKADGYEFYATSFSDLITKIIEGEVSIFDTRNQLMLEDYDFVWFRLWKRLPQIAAGLARYLSFHEVKYVPTEVSGIPILTKYPQMIALSLTGLTVPNTFYADREQLLAGLELPPQFNYPMIVKADDAQKGENNFLINSRTELNEKLSASNDMFIMQNFIPNDGDYRVLVLGGKASVAFFKRRDPKSTNHVNNTAQGATGELVNLVERSDLAELAEAACKSLHREVAGADIVEDKHTGQLAIFEINETPALGDSVMSEQNMIAVSAYAKSLMANES
jgi:glutathione synthase/RimK-type ligase-like ATP-grasp enzyme